MIPTIELKHRLRLAREAAGLRGEDIAQVLEVERTTISNYENGHTRPRKPTLMAWSVATDVPVWWLEGHDREPVGGSQVTVCFVVKPSNVVVDLDSKRRIVGQKAQRPAA